MINYRSIFVFCLLTGTTTLTYEIADSSAGGPTELQSQTSVLPAARPQVSNMPPINPKASSENPFVNAASHASRSITLDPRAPAANGDVMLTAPALTRVPFQWS